MTDDKLKGLHAKCIIRKANVNKMNVKMFSYNTFYIMKGYKSDPGHFCMPFVGQREQFIHILNTEFDKANISLKY